MLIRKELSTIGKEEYILEVHYNKKESFFFFKGLPDDFKTFSDRWKNQSVFSSESVLWSEYTFAKEEYLKNKETSRKVIVFRAVASPEIIMNPNLNDKPAISGSRSLYTGFKKESFKKLHSNNFGMEKFEIGFTFYVMTEKESSGYKEYFLHELDREFNEVGLTHQYSKFNNRMNDFPYTVVEYSDEILEYFVTMSKQFTAMAEKMATFFGEANEASLLEYIEANKKLGFNG